MSLSRRAVAAALAAVAWGGMRPGRAATVYRCGADGRSFSQTPCRDTESAPVALPAAPDDARVAEARDVAARDAAAADRMARQRERLAQDAVRGPAVIPHRPLDPPREPGGRNGTGNASGAARRERRARRPDTFRAVTPRDRARPR